MSIKKVDYITYEYNTIYQIFYDILKDYVQVDKNNNPNITLLATDKVLSYLHQDKTGLVKYPFVTIQLVPYTPISTGGSFDYQTSSNQDLRLSYYESDNYNKLFTQNIPLRIQQDNITINVNLWQYSYQQLSLLRDVIQRTFTLPKKISKTIDLSQYVKDSFTNTDRITQTLLDNLYVLYDLPLYIRLGGVTDSTPSNLTNNLPIKKLSYIFTQDSWIPTDIDITNITGLIEDIRLTFYINDKNTQEATELIGDKIQNQIYVKIQSEYNINQ